MSSNYNNSSRMRELCAASLSGIGIVGAAEARVVAGVAATGEPYYYWQRWARPEYFHTDIQAAHDACQGGDNEVVFITPEIQYIGGATTSVELAWSKNMTHLVGMYGPAMQNMRSRITHVTTLPVMCEVSGYGNTFANLYFMYGVANTDLNCLLVSGNRNSFINCHFLQQVDTALDSASFKMVNIQGSETYFKNCVFGADTILWTGAGALVGYGSNANPPRAIFENCVFIIRADAAAPFFLKIAANTGIFAQFFRNCLFLNMGTSMTYAIDGTGIGSGQLVFDNNSYFAGPTDVIAAAYTANVWAAPCNTAVNQVTGGASTRLFNLLGVNVQVS